MIICLVSVFVVSAISYLVSARITADLSDTRIRELTASQAKELDTWFAIKEMIISSMAQDIETGNVTVLQEHLSSSQIVSRDTAVWIC